MHWAPVSTVDAEVLQRHRLVCCPAVSLMSVLAAIPSPAHHWDSNALNNRREKGPGQLRAKQARCGLSAMQGHALRTFSKSRSDAGPAGWRSPLESHPHGAKFFNSLSVRDDIGGADGLLMPMSSACYPACAASRLALRAWLSVSPAEGDTREAPLELAVQYVLQLLLCCDVPAKTALDQGEGFRLRPWVPGHQHLGCRKQSAMLNTSRDASRVRPSAAWRTLRALLLLRALCHSVSILCDAACDGQVVACCWRLQ